MPTNEINRKRPNGVAQTAPGATAQAAPAAPGVQAPKALTAPAGAPQGAPQTSQPAAGTGFVNLQRILNANQGAGQRMGQQIIQSVQAKGQAAQQATTDAQAKYQQATQAAVGTYNPAAAGAATAAILAKQQKNDEPYFYGNVDATLSDGRADTLNQNLGYQRRSEAAQKELDILDPLSKVEYAGPKDWKEAGIDNDALTAQALRAQEEAAALGSSSGRSALLSQQFAGPRSSGASTLDSLLVNDAVGGQADEVAGGFAGLQAALTKARETQASVYDAAKAKQGDVNAKYAADAVKYKRDKEIADTGFAATDRPNFYEHTRENTPIGGGATNPGVLPGRNPYTGESTFPASPASPAPVQPRNARGGINWYNRGRP